MNLSSIMGDRYYKEPKKPTFQSKARKAFRIVEERLVAVEWEVKQARDAALSLCDSVLQSVPAWRDEWKREHESLRKRVDELERKINGVENG